MSVCGVHVVCVMCVCVCVCVCVVCLWCVVCVCVCVCEREEGGRERKKDGVVVCVEAAPMQGRAA